MAFAFPTIPRPSCRSTGAVIVATRLAGHEIDDDRLRKNRMRVLFKIRIGEERDFWRCGVEFQQVEICADFEAFPEFCDRDPENCGNPRIIARIEEIHRTRQALAERQGIQGLAVFGGGHE